MGILLTKLRTPRGTTPFSGPSQARSSRVQDGAWPMKTSTLRMNASYDSRELKSWQCGDRELRAQARHCDFCHLPVGAAVRRSKRATRRGAAAQELESEKAQRKKPHEEQLLVCEALKEVVAKRSERAYPIRDGTVSNGPGCRPVHGARTGRLDPLEAPIRSEEAEARAAAARAAMASVRRVPVLWQPAGAGAGAGAGDAVVRR